MKTYVGMARDHTGSMHRLASAAQRDFNAQLATLQAAALQHNQDTIATVVTIGVGNSARIGREVVNSNVHVIKPLAHYETDAPATALIDATNELLDILEAVPDANDENVAFLVMITTDGGENVARWKGRELAARIRRLQATGRWTFAFRVPKNGARELAALGISNVNVYEWDATSVRGVEESTAANVAAYTDYFEGRSTGMKATTRFYANLADVSVEELQKQLIDISDRVTFYDVTSADHQSLIRPFVESRIGEAMVRGGAFYQLVKTEPKVQANKRIAIRDRVTGTVFAGDAARQMLALPTIGTVRLAPDELGDFDVFIQSTSVNRKLDANTQLMYWKEVGKAFKEGPSAR